MYICLLFNTLQHTATHCNTLQRSATHCNALQHTATPLFFWNAMRYCGVLPCDAMCCSRVAVVLQLCCSRVAVVLQSCCSRVAVVLQSCCSAVQRNAVSCLAVRVAVCVAERCSIVVFCSVLLVLQLCCGALQRAIQSQFCRNRCGSSHSEFLKRQFATKITIRD